MDQTVAAQEKSRDRLVDITLDTKSLGRANSNIEHEREVAIFDILDGNAFRIDGMDAGPYKLHLCACRRPALRWRSVLRAKRRPWSTRLR